MNKNNGNVEGKETKNLNPFMSEENKDKVEQEAKPVKRRRAPKRVAKRPPKGERTWKSLQVSRQG